jgi:hypothetical protein
MGIELDSAKEWAEKTIDDFGGETKCSKRNIG